MLRKLLSNFKNEYLNFHAINKKLKLDFFLLICFLSFYSISAFLNIQPLHNFEKFDEFKYVLINS